MEVHSLQGICSSPEAVQTFCVSFMCAKHSCCEIHRTHSMKAELKTQLYFQCSLMSRFNSSSTYKSSTTIMTKSYGIQTTTSLTPSHLWLLNRRSFGGTF